MVGIPQKTPAGLSAGKLSDFIRAEFEKRFPEEEMERLASSTCMNGRKTMLILMFLTESSGNLS